MCAQIVQVHESTNYVSGRFVTVLAPLSQKEVVEVVSLAPRGQISERLCQQIVDVSDPHLAVKFCAGMLSGR